MMNDVIVLELKKGKGIRGGSFVATASFCLDNISMPFDMVDAKIDTGCSISTIPLQRYKISESLCKKLKEKDILDNREYIFSYGVETGGLKHPIPVNTSEKMDCPAMKFKHDVSGFVLEGVSLPVKDIFVNYDRHGNILIGMDILEMLEMHVGESKVDGRTLLIACPKQRLSEEYYDAISLHFGLVDQ